MRRKPSIDDVFATLADPSRRGVVELLKQGPRRAGELADALDLSAPAMSRHLRTLRQIGFIEEQRVEEDARVRLFRLRREPLESLATWVHEIEGYWQDQLASFKRVAEARKKKRSKPRKRT